jgi:hypothetical protein
MDQWTLLLPGQSFRQKPKGITEASRRQFPGGQWMAEIVHDKV